MCDYNTLGGGGSRGVSIQVLRFRGPKAQLRFPLQLGQALATLAITAKGRGMVFEGWGLGLGAFRSLWAQRGQVR